MLSEDEICKTLQEQADKIDKDLEPDSSLQNLSPLSQCNTKERKLVSLLLEDIELSMPQAKKIWKKLHTLFYDKNDNSVIRPSFPEFSNEKMVKETFMTD